MIWSDWRGSWARLRASVGVLLDWRGNGRWRGFRGLVGNVWEVIEDGMKGV